MDKQGKNYIYYVGTLSRWWLVPADNVLDAIEQAKPYLGQSDILTCRVATREEIASHVAAREMEIRLGTH